MEANMLIGVSEGAERSFEIDERTEGYLVRPRLRQNGRVETDDMRMFRTAVAAFAFAELEAALELYAEARLEGVPEEAALANAWHEAQAIFDRISDSLLDEGIAMEMLDAWAAYEDAQERRRLH